MNKNLMIVLKSFFSLSSFQNKDQLEKKVPYFSTLPLFGNFWSKNLHLRSTFQVIFRKAFTLELKELS